MRALLLALLVLTVVGSVHQVVSEQQQTENKKKRLQERYPNLPFPTFDFRLVWIATTTQTRIAHCAAIRLIATLAFLHGEHKFVCMCASSSTRRYKVGQIRHSCPVVSHFWKRLAGPGYLTKDKARFKVLTSRKTTTAYFSAFVLFSFGEGSCCGGPQQ